MNQTTGSTDRHGEHVPTAARATIGLGSNLGDREAMLHFALRALDRLPDVSLVAASRIYESDAVGPGEQGAYLNAAVALDTTLRPRNLLEELLAIELSAGRNRESETARWSPRTLDLDLLFYGGVIVASEGLHVPHPRLHERAFVLEPLCDLAPDFVHPGMHQSIADLAKAVRDDSAVRVWSAELVLPR